MQHASCCLLTWCCHPEIITFSSTKSILSVNNCVQYKNRGDQSYRLTLSAVLFPCYGSIRVLSMAMHIPSELCMQFPLTRPILLAQSCHFLSLLLYSVFPVLHTSHACGDFQNIAFRIKRVACTRGIPSEWCSEIMEGDLILQVWRCITIINNFWLENGGASTFQNPMGFHGLLQV
jgi:hypothetical protein